MEGVINILLLPLRLEEKFVERIKKINEKR